MKASRIAVLLVAMGAAAGAFFLASSPKPAPPPVAAALPAPPPPATADVLVAVREVPLGTVLADADLNWQAWPKAGLAPGFIVKDATPKAADDFKGAIARENLHAGVPLNAEQVIKGANGFMSAILPAGKRAVAINVDTSGANSAGGFILPNDHVDVIHLFTDDAAKPPIPGAAAPMVSETILRNIRVLAIGPNVQSKDGQSVVSGSTATLELDPTQAETVTLAQRTGQLSLALRSILDINAAGSPGGPKTAAQTVTVVRFGFTAEGTVR